MSTVRCYSDGIAGWPVAQIESNPYSSCEHDDHAVSGTNRVFRV